MSNPSQPSSFFDRKFITTMILVFAIWMGWQSYMAKKYPDAHKPAPAQAETSINGEKPGEKGAAGTVGGKDATGSELPEGHKSTAIAESFVAVSDDVWNFKISSVGMALRGVELKKYTDREGHPIAFAKDDDLSLFSTGLAGRREPLNFVMEKKTDNQIVGVANVEGMKITKILNLDSNNYSIKTVVRAEKLSDAFTGLTTRFTERLLPVVGRSLLSPNTDHQEFYAHHDGSETRLSIDGKTPKVESYSQANVASLGSHYFATAIVDQSPTMADFKAATVIGEKGQAMGALTHALLNKSDNFSIEYTAFVGPKSYDLLKSIDADLVKVIDFGFFRTIAKGIMWLMQTIHAAMGNWGIAIIFLTILVRLIVLPFNVIGYKQMKAMAKIQPAIKALREKYKSDPQKLNQEMLALMKEAKANPLGGCLPMFFQIPIFFALYRVIGQSIELYHAPFAFWIQDLSLKDPYYVLPAFMGITMFVQQKITPNTMEPSQQKIMMFMPIFFTFLMISLPSGLTLYMFVSSLFGVLQQIYYTKDKPVAATA